MDMTELIESHRFLGHEFLIWMWYKCDVFEGRFMIGKRPCEVWFDDRITLEAVMVETEQSVLKGASPTFTPEAREALRQGKTPTQAKLRLIHEGQEFQFVFKGAEFKMSGIKLPALMTRTDDEKFYERMYLVELLEELVEDLYGEFLGLRLSEVAWPKLVEALRAWIHDDARMAIEDYTALRDQAPPLPRLRAKAKTAAESPASIEATPADPDPAEIARPPRAAPAPEAAPPA